jgi:hypothetical protein
VHINTQWQGSACTAPVQPRNKKSHLCSSQQATPVQPKNKPRLYSQKKEEEKGHRPPALEHAPPLLAVVDPLPVVGRPVLKGLQSAAVPGSFPELPATEKEKKEKKNCTHNHTHTYKKINKTKSIYLSALQKKKKFILGATKK